jgi:Outer membrane protein
MTINRLRAYIVAFLMIFAVGGAAEAAGDVIGVVEHQTIMAAHPDMESVFTRIQADQADAQKDYDTNTTTMTPEQKEEYIVKLQQELVRKEIEYMNPIGTSIDAAIAKVAEKRGITMVFPKAQILYGGIDITDEVVKELQKK